MSSSDVSLLQPSPLLLVIPSVGAAKDGDTFILDEKMLVGWQYFAKHWPGRTRFVFRETDRKRAIAFAITQAKAGDVVLIAGKGHETYQVLKNETIHFDDRETVRAVLSSLGYRETQPKESEQG